MKFDENGKVIFKEIKYFKKDRKTKKLKEYSKFVVL